jgi:hypothetical protein
MALSQSKKGGAVVPPKSALLAQALQQISKLSGKRQDAIALQLLEILEDTPEPASARFQALIEFKYTRGLTQAEATELKSLEALFEKREEPFYRPILERVAQMPDLQDEKKTPVSVRRHTPRTRKTS